MDTTVENLLNAPIPLAFRTKSSLVEYRFHELTLLEQSNYTRKLNARARSEWLARLREVAETVAAPIERRKFLAEAAQHEPDLSSEITRLAMTLDGIKWAMQAGSQPEITDAAFADINSEVENSINMTKAMRIIFGSPEETAKEETTEGNPTVAEKGAETPPLAPAAAAP